MKVALPTQLLGKLDSEESDGSFLETDEFLEGLSIHEDGNFVTDKMVEALRLVPDEIQSINAFVSSALAIIRLKEIESAESVSKNDQESIALLQRFAKEISRSRDSFHK